MYVFRLEILTKLTISKCSTQPLCKLLTSMLIIIEDNLHCYYEFIYSRAGVNQKWILNTFKISSRTNNISLIDEESNGCQHSSSWRAKNIDL